MPDGFNRAAVRAGTWLLWGLLLVFGGLLAYALGSLPSDADGGLADAALRDLDRSGVAHPVTAVLMSFRAYDTLLEIAVLFLAVLGVWSMAVMPRRPSAAPGLVLEFLIQLLVPFLILFAGYLLWAGSQEPGGAFQAGAVLAAAGVLATLSGKALPEVPRSLHRLALMLGLVAFVAIGVGVLLFGQTFLELRPPLAKGLILAIEAAAGVSIGLSLLAIFRGGRPPDRAEPRR
jgi:multisubunit Na+/H+ antiporter MnhB subunit